MKAAFVVSGAFFLSLSAMAAGSCESAREAVRSKYASDGALMGSIASSQNVLLHSERLSGDSHMRAANMVDLKTNELPSPNDKKSSQYEDLRQAGIKFGKSADAAKKKFCSLLKDARGSSAKDLARLKSESCLNDEVKQGVRESVGKYDKVYKSCCEPGFGVADPICSL